MVIHEISEIDGIYYIAIQHVPGVAPGTNPEESVVLCSDSLEVRK